MLSRDVRLEGFTADDWVRLAAVFRRPPVDGDRARTVQEGRPRGGVIAVSAEGTLRKLLSTRRGRLDLAGQPWPEPLDEVARRYGARWAVQLENGALEELMERFAQRVERDQDALAQIVTFVGALRELEAEGRIRVWPWRLGAWPVPHERLVLRAFDALCPDGKAILLGVFQEGELFTGVVARRKGSGFDLLLGPDKLRPEMGLVSGDWRRDYRHLARAAEQAAGPLALGCFGELDTLRELVHSPAPGAWAAAVAARDIVLSPAVPAVALPLGIDVGRAAFVAVRDLAERMGASGWLGPEGPLGPAWSRVRELTGVDRDIKKILGFDPMELMRRILSRTGER